MQKKLLLMALVTIYSLHGMEKTIVIKQLKKHRELSKEIVDLEEELGTITKNDKESNAKREWLQERLHVLNKSLGKIKVEEVLRPIPEYKKHWIKNTF